MRNLALILCFVIAIPSPAMLPFRCQVTAAKAVAGDIPPLMEINPTHIVYGNVAWKVTKASKNDLVMKSWREVAAIVHRGLATFDKEGKATVTQLETEGQKILETLLAELYPAERLTCLQCVVATGLVALHLVGVKSQATTSYVSDVVARIIWNVAPVSARAYGDSFMEQVSTKYGLGREFIDNVNVILAGTEANDKKLEKLVLHYGTALGNIQRPHELPALIAHAWENAPRLEPVDPELVENLISLVYAELVGRNAQQIPKLALELLLRSWFRNSIRYPLGIDLVAGMGGAGHREGDSTLQEYVQKNGALLKAFFRYWLSNERRALYVHEVVMLMMDLSASRYAVDKPAILRGLIENAASLPKEGPRAIKVVRDAVSGREMGGPDIVVHVEKRRDWYGNDAIAREGGNIYKELAKFEGYEKYFHEFRSELEKAVFADEPPMLLAFDRMLRIRVRLEQLAPTVAEARPTAFASWFGQFTNEPTAVAAAPSPGAKKNVEKERVMGVLKGL